MLTIRPWPAAFMPGSTAWMPCTAPMRLRSSASRQALRLVFSKDADVTPPALLTSKPIGPFCLIAPCTVDWTASASVTSMMAMDDVFVAVWAARSFVLLRPASVTVHPAFTSVVAVANPMPLPPPVTSACLPLCANEAVSLARENSLDFTGRANRVVPGAIMDPQKFVPSHFQWAFADGIATVTLNRPERKNPLTFESYAELRDTFRALVYVKTVKAVVLRGAGGNFCSGGDVHEIIGPLVRMEMTGLMAFTRMTGDLVKAIRACPQPVIAAVNGVCAGAGAILAMAS